METVVIFIMLLVGLGYLLKLTFMRPWIMIAEAAVIGFAVVLSTDYAIMQSKTQIADWLQTPELMLNLAVVMTVDVMFQIGFCVSMLSEGSSFRKRAMRGILLYFPGFLIFPVMFYLLVQMIFTFVGADFNTVGFVTGLCLLCGAPLVALVLKQLIPERFLRLEMIFYINCLVGILGIIASVNGRTATVGVNELNLAAFATMAALTLGGAIVGLILYQRKKHKQQ